MAKKTANLSAIVREAVRRERKARGLTQEELCQAAGISIDAVTRIEAGSRTPNLATVERLAEALAINPAKLLDREPAPSEPSVPLRRIIALLEPEPRPVQEAAEAVVRSLLKAAKSVGVERKAKKTEKTPRSRSKRRRS